MRAFFGLDAVFPSALAHHESFVQWGGRMYQRVRDEGVLEALTMLFMRHGGGGIKFA